MKRCSKCKIEKILSDFYIEKGGKAEGKPTAWCKQCCAEQSKKYYANNKVKSKQAHKEWVENNKERVAFTKAKSSYGISEELYKKIKRTCAICFDSKNLVIDHSHQSGRIRGMLCSSCNKGLGFFKDNPMLLSRASDYVFGLIDIMLDESMQSREPSE
jgi:hypothetical protein